VKSLDDKLRDFHDFQVDFVSSWDTVLVAFLGGGARVPFCHRA
jgi:hypothetical protein